MRFKILLSLLLSFSFLAQARIRNRKVKEAPKVCAVMSEDKLLSRKFKKVYSTERHSLVIEENVALVKDKGEKVCIWSLKDWGTDENAVNLYKFYIDEYKEVLYAHKTNEDNSVEVIQIPFNGCKLDDRLTLVEFKYPKCEAPKKSSKKKRKVKSKK